MKTANVEVKRNPNENSASLVRRFTKRMQGSGVLRRVRGLRFHTREDSEFKRRSRALMRMKKTKEIERLKKMGKIQ